MNPNQGREAAYVKSRVKDLSRITNAPDYVGLFACITPKAHAELENEENIIFMENGSPTDNRDPKNRVYLPQLVRDVETLNTLFGDPRVDPETYKDLMAVQYIVQNGFACYIAKVRSGEPYSATVTSEGLFESAPCQVNNQLFETGFEQLYNDLRNVVFFTAQSSIIGHNKLTVRLIPYKPYSINQVSLEVSFTSKATDVSEEINIVTTRITLTPDTKNSDFIKTLNSYLGGDLICQLPSYMDDSVYATPYDAYTSIESDEGKYFCIVNTLLYIAGVYKLKNSDENSNDYLLIDNMTLVGLSDGNVYDNWLRYYNVKNNQKTFECLAESNSTSTLKVTQSDYVNSISTFNDPKYSGSFISELSSNITHTSYTEKSRFIPKNNLISKEKPSLSDEDINKNTFINLNEYDYIVTYGDLKDGVIPVTFSNRSANYKGIGLKDETGDTPIFKIENEKAKQNRKDLVIYVTTKTDGYLTDADLVLGDDKAHIFNESTDTEDGKLIGNKVYFICKDPNIDPSHFRYTTNPVILEDTTEIKYGDNTNPGNILILADTYVEAPKNATDILNYPLYYFNPTGKSLSDFTRASLNTEPTYYVEGSDTEEGEEKTFIPIVKVKRIVDGSERNEESDEDAELHQRTTTSLMEMSGDDRRGLHYIIKQIAATRKNLTCIFTTPYCPLVNGEYDPNNIYDLPTACNWVAARGEFADLFEYGNSQAIEYPEQAFYCEMYWSWLKWRVVKLVNGLATGSTTVIVPASAFVILNALTSYRIKGSFYPVAGDQGGVLPDSCVILQNPSTKSQRDKLISYRINPIYDTGVRGIQIYGNETLNPLYTDLSAAHIARTLVQIRSQVDAYSETIKFKLNDMYTWSQWITYVSTKILDPIKSLGGLQWYQVDMGYNTTTRNEISQRKIRGMISLQFTPDLEIIDLEFVIQSSELDLTME